MSKSTNFNSWNHKDFLCLSAQADFFSIWKLALVLLGTELRKPVVSSIPGYSWVVEGRILRAQQWQLGNAEVQTLWSPSDQWSKTLSTEPLLPKRACQDLIKRSSHAVVRCYKVQRVSPHHGCFIKAAWTWEESLWPHLLILNKVEVRKQRTFQIRLLLVVFRIYSTHVCNLETLPLSAHDPLLLVWN